MTTCTWTNCQKEACCPQKRGDGSIWPNLCQVHNDKIEEAIQTEDTKALLSCWVRASGGAKTMAGKSAKNAIRRLYNN